MDNIQISYPNHFLFFIAVIALLFALSLYINDRRIKENKSWLPFILGWLRFLSVLGILFLLLTPLLKIFETNTEKPQIIIARDISASISAATDTTVLNKMTKDLATMKESLSEKFEFLELEFGEKLIFDKNDSVNIQSTNISKPLEYISDAYEDQNLGAVVVITDGIYNEGKNPIYADLQFTAPVYCVALGDSTIRTDVLVKNVLHNRIVYLNDKFLIEVDLQAYNCQGAKTRVNLYRVSNGRNVKLDSKPMSINDSNYFQSVQFELQATQVGDVKYIVEVERVNNEITYVNNTRNLYLEVLDARQKILLFSDAPHPDLKAIKSIVNDNKNYEVEFAYAGETSPSLKAYDIIVLHSLPSRAHPLSSQLAEINRLKKPVMFITGNKTDWTGFSAAQNVLSIAGAVGSANDVTPVLNRDFTLFTLTDEIKSKIESFVPVKAPFADYKLGLGSKALLSQQIGSVETQYPLIAYSDLNNHRQCVITGEGIWRWKLIEYLNTGEYNLSKEVLQKSIQYISEKEDKRQFRAFANKNNYKENEGVFFDAQLYNDSYEPINTPESQLTISNASGEKFEYTFSKKDNFYFIDAGRFPEGNYSFQASTNYGGKALKANGKFSVQSIIREQFDLTAKHDILQQLSSKFGGEVIQPNDIQKLSALISEDNSIKPIIYQKAETKPLMEWQWLLGIIIFLLGLEWFIRRYFGGY